MSDHARQSLRIAFTHNYYIQYRIPLFELVAQRYDATFLFDAKHPYLNKKSEKISFKIPLSVHIGVVVFPLLSWFYLIRGKFNLFIAGDATNLSTVVAFAISKLLRKPFILWEERWLWVDSIVGNLMWPFARLISMKADALIVPGSRSRVFYETLGINADKLFIAPNASYAEISGVHNRNAQRLKEELGLKDALIILYLGRVVKIKGVHILLKAFADLCNNSQNNLYLIIAGDDTGCEYKRELNHLCENFDLHNVHFTGVIPEDEKASYLQIADLVVCPSILEVWGLVINEAMSVGKPVISTTSSGGACDLIVDGVNGYKIPPANAEALHDALKKLVENPELIKAFGEASRRTIERGYSYGHMFEGFCKAIAFALETGAC